MIFALLVITGVVSAIAVNMTHEVMHKDADRILKNAAQREAAYINDVLGDVEKSSFIMEHYATTSVVRAEDLRDEDFRENYLREAEVMFSEIARKTTGISGFYFRLDPSVSNGTTGFYKMIKDDDTAINMLLTDLEKYDKSDVKNVGWYYNALSAIDGTWMDPYYFPGIEDRLISFVHPMYVEDDLIGVIGFDMDFAYLTERIGKIGVYEDGYAVLVAKDGETWYTGKEHHNSSSRNPHTEARVELMNGMYLELHADYEDIQREIRPMLNKIVIAFLVVLAFSILYTILVTQKIVRPLKQLTEAVRDVSGIADKDRFQLTIHSKDEIGTLSRALDATYVKLREYTAHINALAYRDSLTGIKNSTSYAEAVAELNKEINTGNPRFGVVVADINNLKDTNDRYGHDVGNDLIVQTSKSLSDVFKTSAVFRIGGDEFVAILQGEDYDCYHRLLGEFDRSCSEHSIKIGESFVSVSVARGAALYDSSIDRVYEDVFAKADQAMYLNKEATKRSASK